MNMKTLDIDGYVLKTVVKMFYSIIKSLIMEAEQMG